MLLNGSIPYHSAADTFFAYIVIASLLTILIEWAGLYLWLRKTQKILAQDLLLAISCLNALTLLVGLSLPWLLGGLVL